MPDNVIDKMAKLVLENPAITVKELAARMQYSQEKSIYYWLEKADFRGIREFKEAVFRGYYGTPTPSEKTQVEETTTVPFLDWNFVAASHDLRLSQEARARILSIPLNTDVGKDAFAVESPADKPPYLYRGDILVIAPSGTPHDGDFVLVRTRNGLDVARKYGQRNPLYVELISGRPISGKPRALGKIVRLIRSF